ncbi:MAG: matrixin family metalloprotease [Chitinophagales bacterium]|nr:matrixin family metalloprotease [Chitinophagales bacterium]
MKYKIVLIIISLLLLSCNKNASIVEILPYENFNTKEVDTIKAIFQNLFPEKQIIVKEKQALPKSAFINIKSPRYRADEIIKILSKETVANTKTVALTNSDISTTKYENGKVKQPAYKYKDWGIMGLAYCPGKACVVSSFRIKHPNYTVYIDRLKKVSVHELGHTLGLRHCANKKCVMTDAVEKVSTIDNANLAFCEQCRTKLK